MSSQSLQPGELVQIAPLVWRLVAPNGGPMTGPGTNSYLLGANRSIILDPGPLATEHLDALAAATTRVTHVLVTHTHKDHSPAAAFLAQQFSAQLIGLAPPPLAFQDRSFVPDVEPVDDAILQLNDICLRCVHTPGHASNHLCYLLEPDRWLFTGDHVMQGSTVVIPPPDGSMGDYLQSLHKISALQPTAIAPGHGNVIRDTDRAIRRLIRHRLQREARVIDRLQKTPGATLQTLLPLVYSDVPVQRHAVAALSLHAHLLKLLKDQRVELRGEHWSVVG